jgi:peptide/nickel transport system substrate-binding protein
VSFTTIDPISEAALAGIYANTQSNILDSKEYLAHATDSDPWSMEWAKSNYVGYGPYKIKDFTPGSQLIYESFENYWEGAPKIKTIILREIQEPSTRAILLATGEINVAEWLDARTAASLKNQPNLSIWSGGNLWTGVILNNKVKPFDDVRVRQALAWATPYDDISKVAYSGLSVPWHSLGVSNFLIGYTEENWPYIGAPNYEKAKTLLKDAGYGDGIQLILDYATQFIKD